MLPWLGNRWMGWNQGQHMLTYTSWWFKYQRGQSELNTSKTDKMVVHLSPTCVPGGGRCGGGQGLQLEDSKHGHCPQERTEPSWEDCDPSTSVWPVCGGQRLLLCCGHVMLLLGSIKPGVDHQMTCWHSYNWVLVLIVEEATQLKLPTLNFYQP